MWFLVSARWCGQSSVDHVGAPNMFRIYEAYPPANRRMALSSERRTKAFNFTP
jgi:hypothetical protein